MQTKCQSFQLKKLTHWLFCKKVNSNVWSKSCHRRRSKTEGLTKGLKSWLKSKKKYNKKQNKNLKLRSITYKRFFWINAFSWNESGEWGGVYWQNSLQSRVSHLVHIFERIFANWIFFAKTQSFCKAHEILIYKQ